MELCKSFGCFDAQTVQVEIFCVFAAFEQALRLKARSRANGYQRQSDHVHLARGFRREEVRNRQSAALSLTRECEAENLREPILPARAARMSGLPLRRLVHDDIIAVALGREVSVHDGRCEEARLEYFVFQLTQDGAELFVHEPQVIRLRCRLQLPLVLEQRSLVDITEKLAQVIILLDAHPPKRRCGDIRSVGDNSAALRKYRAGLFVDGGGFRIFLYGASLLNTLLACAVRSRKVFHDVKTGEGVVGIEHAVGVLAPQIVLYILSREGCATANHGELELLPFKILDDILHLEG